MTGPKSLTAKRLISRDLTQDHRKLWDTLREEYGYRLNASVKKHRNSPGFVLEAIRGKGKSKTRLQSCKLKLVFKSKTEARSVESGVKFGDSLLSTLEVKRKRYRGKIECDRDNTLNSSVVPKKSKSNKLTNKVLHNVYVGGPQQMVLNKKFLPQRKVTHISNASVTGARNIQ